MGVQAGQWKPSETTGNMKVLAYGAATFTGTALGVVPPFPSCP